LPLVSGATLVIANEEERSDPHKLLSLIKKTNISVLQLTPSYFKEILSSLETFSSKQREQLLSNNLRLILFASEPLEVEVAQRWFKYSRTQKLYNMYGQTETSGVFLTKEIIPSYKTGHLVPLGKPISSAIVYILNQFNKPQKLGKIGEICV